MTWFPCLFSCQDVPSRASIIVLNNALHGKAVGGGGKTASLGVLFTVG